MIELGIIVVAIVFIWLYAGKDASGTKNQPEESAVEHGEAVVAEPAEITPEAEDVEPVVEQVASKIEEDGVAVSVVPQDSTLRRHYMQNLMANKENKGEQVPEDSTLRRHFMQQLFAEVAATMADRPTDSTLKRHYDAQLSSAVADRLEALK